MGIKIINLLFISILITILLASCQKNDTLTAIPQTTEAQELTLLAKYIAKYHPGLLPKNSGLFVIETKAAPLGADSIRNGDVVHVFYSGYLISDDAATGVKDGYNFDNSGTVTPFTFTVGAGSVIQGWDLGATYMTSGSEVKLIIPSRLAYYNQSGNGIPAYSTMIFYMKIAKVTSAK